jgi:predicted AAA+ superfamily ATPase
MVLKLILQVSFRILSSRCPKRILEKSIIVESIAASHLARKFNIGYWRNRGEIYVVFGGMVGFEVKYMEKLQQKDWSWKNQECSNTY